MRIEHAMLLLNAFNVKRFHTAPILHTQTVGDHTARVVVLLYYLNGKPPREKLIRAALEHDGLEHITGDIPATAKWLGNFGQVVKEVESKLIEANKLSFMRENELTKDEILLLKVADMAELCCRASYEVALGNRAMHNIFQNGAKYLENLKPQIPGPVWERLMKLLGPYQPKAAATPAAAPQVPPVHGGPDQPQTGENGAQAKKAH